MPSPTRRTAGSPGKFRGRPRPEAIETPRTARRIRMNSVQVGDVVMHRAHRWRVRPAPRLGLSKNRTPSFCRPALLFFSHVPRKSPQRPRIQPPGQVSLLHPRKVPEPPVDWRSRPCRIHTPAKESGGPPTRPWGRLEVAAGMTPRHVRSSAIAASRALAHRVPSFFAQSFRFSAKGY